MGHSELGASAVVLQTASQIHRSCLSAVAGFLAGVLVVHVLQQSGASTPELLRLNALQASSNSAPACPPCRCECLVQQQVAPGSARTPDRIEGHAASHTAAGNLAGHTSKHFCPWDVSQSRFQGADRVVHFGANQSVCLDTILYGYDLVFEREALFGKVKWLGVPNQQDPTDAMTIQEILWKVQPDVVIELGTNVGGGALFYASILSLMQKSFRVITIDPKDFHTDWFNGDKHCLPDYPCRQADSHPLWNQSITFIKDVPTNPQVLSKVQSILASVDATKVVVIEDSAHDYQMVLDNIRAYSPLVTPGSYLIVQDSKITRFLKSQACSNHPTRQERLVCLQQQPKTIGPGDAIATFLREDRNFTVDTSWEFLYYSQHAGGYLQKVAPAASLR